MGLMFYQLDMLHWEMWWVVLLGLIVCVGASNVINFMDGVNGITGAYALEALIVLSVAYVLFKRKYYPLHEAYLASLHVYDLKRRVADFVEMEQRSCSMDLITPEYVARSLQISQEDAAEALEAIKR